MTDADWYDPGLRTLGLFLAGDAIRTRGERGQTIEDDSFLLWLHSGAEPVTVLLPGLSAAYTEVLRTDRLALADEQARPGAGGEPAEHEPGRRLLLAARSVLLLQGR
jgi:isoamylase